MESTDQDTPPTTSPSTPATTKRKHDSNDRTVVSPDSNDCNDEENDNRKRMRPNALLLSESEVAMPSSSDNDEDENIGSLTLNDERLSSQSTHEEVSPPSKSPTNTLVSSESASIAAPIENTDEKHCDSIAPAERLERVSSKDDLSQQRQASSFSSQADIVNLEQLLLGSNKFLAQHKEQSQLLLDLKAKLVHQQKQNEARLQEKEESIKVLNHNLGKANTKSGALQKKRDDLEKAKQEQDKTINVLQHDVQLAAKMLKQERQEHDIQEESQADTIAKLMEEKRSLKKSLTKCQQKLQLRETAITLSEDQLKRVRVELKDSRGTKKELAQELQNQRQLAESRLEDSRQLEEALCAAKTDGTECWKQLRCHEKEMAGLQSHLKETEVKLKDTRCSKKQLMEELESQRVLAAERLEVEHEDHQFKVQVHLKARGELQQELQVLAKFLREKELSASILQHNIQLAEERLEQQGREHKDQNDSQTSTIAKLLKEKCSVEESLSTTRDEAIECQKQLHLREKEIAALQMQLKNVQVELKDTQDTKKKLVDELESQSDFGSKRLEDIRQLDKALSAAKTDATECHHHVTQLEKQMTGLHHELKKVQVELIDTQDTKKKLAEELESQRVVAENCLEEKSGLDKALSAARTDATEYHHQVTLREEQMVELHHELIKAQAAQKDSQSAKKKLAEELESQRALAAERLEDNCGLEKALAAAKTDVAEFQRRVRLHDSSVVELRRQLKKVQVNLKDMQSTKKNLAEELEAQITVTEKCLEEKRGLDKALSAAKTDATECHHQVTLREEQMVKLHHELIKAQAAQKDSQSAKKKLVEELESQRVVAEKCLEEKRGLDKALSAAKTDATECHKQVTLLENQMLGVHHELEKVQVELQGTQDTKKQVVEELESQRALAAGHLEEKCGLSEALSAAKTEATKFQIQVTLREKQMVGLHHMLIKVQVVLKDTQSAKDQLVEELESQKVLAAQRLEENSRLDKALSDAKTDINECHKQVTLREEQMVKLHHELIKAQAAQKDSQSAKKKLAEELESQIALAAERLEEKHKVHQFKEAARLKARIACQQELQVLVKSNQEKEDAVSLLQHKVQLAEERLGQQCQEHKAQNESQTNTIANLLSEKRSVEESLSTTRDDYCECQKQLQLRETETEAIQQQSKEVQLEMRDTLSALSCELHKERQRHQTEVKSLIDRRNTLEKDIQVLQNNKSEQEQVIIELQKGSIQAESRVSVVAKLEVEKLSLEEALLSSRRSLATTQHQLQSLGTEMAETQRQLQRIEKEKNELQQCLNEKTQGSKRGVFSSIHSLFTREEQLEPSRL